MCVVSWYLFLRVCVCVHAHRQACVCFAVSICAYLYVCVCVFVWRELALEFHREESKTPATQKEPQKRVWLCRPTPFHWDESERTRKCHMRERRKVLSVCLSVRLQGALTGGRGFMCMSGTEGCMRGPMRMSRVACTPAEIYILKRHIVLRPQGL